MVSEGATGHSYRSLQVRGTKQSNERGVLELRSSYVSFFRELLMHPIKLIPSPARGKLRRVKLGSGVVIACRHLLDIQAARWCFACKLRRTNACLLTFRRLDCGFLVAEQKEFLRKPLILLLPRTFSRLRSFC